MNVKKNPNETTAHALATILMNSLPYIKNTHHPRHLRGIEIDKTSKGKALRFIWNLEIYKVTENLNVSELDFTNTWTKTEEATKVESLLKTKNEPVTILP